MFANTVHVYPVLLMGGWAGIVASMIVEASAIFGYLHRRHSGSWIIRHFVVANVLSAFVGLICFVTMSRYPNVGTAIGNVRSLVIGVGIAYVLTILIERWVYVRKLKAKERPLIMRAIVMGNVFSYAILVGIHLYKLG